MVELSDLGDRRPAQLSGGQQQRVALARALVFEPQLVLMDEPLGALDKHLRETMQYEIMRLHQRLGVTIVYVTHDQAEALTMSDRVAVFHDGRIQQIASPIELYENPANAFVASFVGENNGLTGRVTAVENGHAVLAVAPGVTVRGRAGTDLSRGGEAMLALRPEKLSFGREATDGENRLSGTVDETHLLRRSLAAASHRRRAQRPHHEGAEQAASAPPAPGQPVTISWSCDDCKILAERARLSGLTSSLVVNNHRSEADRCGTGLTWRRIPPAVPPPAWASRSRPRPAGSDLGRYLRRRVRERRAKKAYFEPFTAKTGINFVKEEYDGGLAKLRAHGEARNTTWDLIDLESNDAITGMRRRAAAEVRQEAARQSRGLHPRRGAAPARSRPWCGPRSTPTTRASRRRRRRPSTTSST